MPTDSIDVAIVHALATLVGRRDLLKVAGGGLATLLVDACGAASTPTSVASPPIAAPTASPTVAPSPPIVSSPTTSAPIASIIPSTATPAPAVPTVRPASSTPWVYVFNVGSRDVTVIDTATNAIVATRPLGAAVRWLSNEQRYWDGSNVWTFDFPENKLQAIAIDPKTVKVVHTIDTATSGPGHSLMLAPDLQTAFLNAAGSNAINVIDIKAGTVTDRIATGQFP